jgi:hypothetical protein
VWTPYHSITPPRPRMALHPWGCCRRHFLGFAQMSGRPTPTTSICHWAHWARAFWVRTIKHPGSDSSVSMGLQIKTPRAGISGIRFGVCEIGA